MHNIEVVPQANGYHVYGRFAATIRADSDKNVIYCNLPQGNAERVKMEKALQGHIDTKAPVAI